MAEMIGFMSVAANDATSVDTKAVTSLGTLQQDSNGNLYRYVKNGSGGALAAGDIVKIKPGVDGGVVTGTVTGDAGKYLPIGVVLTAMADGEFAYVGVKGIFTANVDGAPTAGTELMLSGTTAKRLVTFDGLAASSVVGSVMTDVASNSGSVYIY